ncbi:MAG: ABC transporter ATP-binding protein [Burkholderiales bacterium]
MRTSAAAIEITGLSKTYRGASRPALNGASLSVTEGDFFALLGPNGAGKTTLISILCGILAPSSGNVSVRALSGEMLEPRAARALIGLVPQELAFYPTLTVLENLRYFAAMHGMGGVALASGVESALSAGQLQAVRSQRADTLSGGMKRRLNLAIGVVHSPRLLVLDEPTAGVDAQSREYLRQELKRLNAGGMTIVYTSHYLEEVQQLCTTLAMLDHGRVIAQGSLAELLGRDLVTLRFTAPPAPELLARLSAIQSVSAVRQDGTQVALVTPEPQAVLAAALAAASSAGVTEAAMGKRDLEGLFFQLTGKALRDE